MPALATKSFAKPLSVERRGNRLEMVARDRSLRGHGPHLYLDRQTMSLWTR